NGCSVTTTGDHICIDAVTLGTATILSASAGNITFPTTVTGAFELTANGTGTTSFGGAVNVASLTTNAGGTTALNGGSVTTTANKTYECAVGLGVATTLSAGAGKINCASTVASAFATMGNVMHTTHYGLSLD